MALYPLFRPGKLEVRNVRWLLWSEENRRTRRKSFGVGTRSSDTFNHMWCQLRDTNPGHIVGRRALSTLSHPCSLEFIMIFDREDSRFTRVWISWRFSIIRSHSNNWEMLVMWREKPNLPGEKPLEKRREPILNHIVSPGPLSNLVGGERFQHVLSLPRNPPTS